MSWLNFSTIFDKRSRMKEHIQLLEQNIKNSNSRLHQVAAERDALRIKANALERLKKVFIDKGESFFFAAITTKKRFAFVTLDKGFQEIKVWGEYSETNALELQEDCRLEYKFKLHQEAKSLHIVSLVSSTQKQGYATLAVEALARIAFIHDLRLITMKKPEGNDNAEWDLTYCRMGFKSQTSDDQIIGEFYKLI